MPLKNFDSTLLQKIANTAPLLIYVYDFEEKRSVYSNKRIEDILGYTKEDIDAMGPNIHQQLLHPEDFAKNEAIFARIQELKDGEELITVARFKRKSGTYGWFKNTRIVFERNKAGAVKQELGIVLEITDEVNAEQSVLESERKFKSIFNSTSDFNFFVDRDFKIITLNSAAINYMQKYTGVKLLPGSYLTAAMPPQMLVDATEALNTCITGQTVDIIKDYQIEGGKKIWFRAKFFPVFDDDRVTVTGVNINLRDVTKAFESRIALEQHNEQLREIARINSHEIRRPLSNILGLTDLLIHYKEALPKDVVSLLDLLEASSKQLDEVIKRIIITASNQTKA